MVTNAPGVEVGSIHDALIYKLFNVQGVERLMLSKLAALLYILMTDILMVTHTSQGWGGVKK